MIDIRRVKVTTAIIESDDLFQRGEMSVMKIWAAQPDVAQTGRAKLAHVVRVAGHLEAARIFGLWPHTDVMKCVVAEKAAGVTDVASTRIKNSLAASFRGAKRGDLLRVQIPWSSI